MKRLLIFALLLCGQLTFGQIPKPQTNTYVNDFAGVLTKDQVTGLNKKIFKIEQSAKVQLAIVLIDKVPSAYDIQDFAVLIGKKWRVGKNKKGIVYVAAISQRKQRIEVARNLDSVFTGAVCLGIMDEMKPAFKTKDYNAGLEILIAKISSNLQVAPVQRAATASGVASAANQARPATQPVTEKEDTMGFWVGFLFVVGVGILIIVYIRRRNRKQRETQNFYNQGNVNNAGYYNPNQSNPGYGNPDYPGYGLPPTDHTMRNVLTGAALGAAAGYAARTIQDNISDNQHQQGNHITPDNTGAGSSNYNDTLNDMANNDIYNEDSKPNNWGNWADTDNSSNDSSYDSGFSDDSSSDSGGDSDSGGSSDW